MSKPNKVLTIVLVVTILVVAAIPAIASNLTKDTTLTYRNMPYNNIIKLARCLALLSVCHLVSPSFSRSCSYYSAGRR